MTHAYTILDARENEALALAVLDDMTDEAMMDREFIPCDEKDNLIEAIRRSAAAHVVLVDGRPAATGGVCPDPENPGTGIAYMVLARPFMSHPRTAIRVARDISGRYADLFTDIHNINADRKIRTMRMLRAIGFQIVPGYIHNGEPISVVCKSRRK